jgi:hypothetical protein
MIKNKYLVFFLLLFLSCDHEDNIEITNKNLIIELNQFVKKIDQNSPCKSNYITIHFKKNEIEMSNYRPLFTNKFMGTCRFNKSKIFFISDVDCSNYVLVKNKNISSYKDITPLNSCDPPMYRILIIDKENKNKFTYPPSPVIK